MSIAKYKKQLILILMLLGSISGLFLLSGGYSPKLFNFLPGYNQATQVPFIFYFITINSMIGGVLLGYVLAPLFLVVHKKIIGIRMQYGIQESSVPDKFKSTFKAFFPSLMATNFALIFAFDPFIIDIVVVDESFATGELLEIKPLLNFVVLLIITSGIAMALFSPVWFLLDSGLVYTNKEKVKDKIEPIELRSVGGWYMYLLKGYAGIGVIIEYIIFMGAMIEAHGDKIISLIPP